MLKKTQANREYLKSLIKEVIDSPVDDNAIEKTSNSEPSIDISYLKEQDVENELQNFIDFLSSADVDGALASLEKLLTTGHEIDDIYFAAANKLEENNKTSMPIAEQELNQDEEGMELLNKRFTPGDFDISGLDKEDRQLDSSLTMMMIIASSLRRQGDELEASRVEEIIDEMQKYKLAGERELALALLTSNHFKPMTNLYPDREELAINRWEVQEAGVPWYMVARAAGEVFKKIAPKALKKIFTKGSKKTPVPKSSSPRYNPKPGETIPRRATRQKAKARKRRRKYDRKRRGGTRSQSRSFRRSPKPPAVPPAVQAVGRFKQLMVILGVANLVEVVGAVATVVENIIKMGQSAKLNLLYEGSQVQYALEKFSDEQSSQTVGFEKARLFFSLFSKWDAHQIDCYVEDFNTPQAAADSCSNRINKPDSYYLPDDVKIALEQEEANTLSANSVEDYLEIYSRYKSFFEESVTNFVLENIFITDKAAAMWAVVAADNNLDPLLYIKHCFKPILDLENYNIRKIEQKGFWQKVARAMLVEVIEPDSSVLSVLEEYKDDFISKNFDYEFVPESSEEIESINDIRSHFSAISAASMTAMVDYPGGYDALMECLMKSDMFSNKDGRITYSVQSDFTRNILAAIIGGAMDTKIIEMLISYAKRKMNMSSKSGPTGWLWGALFVSEMSFYFLDPINIYDRSQISKHYQNITNLINEEAEYWKSQNESKWYIREEQLDKIKSEINLIYDQLLEELESSIEGFYDMTRTNQSACQQLKDKIQIRNAAFKQITKFKQASFQGLQVYEKTPEDFHEKQKINDLTISYKNYSYILETLPEIEETMIELHKQIAVPEVGFFMMIPGSEPVDFINTLRNPLDAKNREEEEEKADKKADLERAQFCAENPRACGIGPANFGIPEGNNDYLHKYILTEQSITNTARDKAFHNKYNILIDKEYAYPNSGKKDESLLDNLIWEDEGRETVVKFLKNISAAAGLFQYSDFAGSNLEKRLLKVAKFGYHNAIEYSTDPADIPVLSDDEDTDAVSLVKIEIDINQIISDGFENFKKSITSQAKFFNHEEDTPRGCLIEIPVQRYSKKGGLYRQGNGNGYLLIARPRIGISMKYPSVSVGKPIIKQFSASANITQAGDSYLNNIKSLYELFNEEIKAEKTYKVIYDPKDVVITKKNQKEFMTNTSYKNNSANIPVVDMLVSEFAFSQGNYVPSNFFSKAALDDGHISEDSAAQWAGKAIEALNSYIAIANNTKYYMQNLDNAEAMNTTKYNDALDELQKEYGNPDIVDHNISTANMIIGLCKVGKSMINSFLNARVSFQILASGGVGLQEDYLGKNKSTINSSVRSIQDNINKIKDLYFVRPAGYVQDRDKGTSKDLFFTTGDRIGGKPVSAVLPGEEAIERSRIDMQRSSRYMYEKNLEKIIKSNKQNYDSIVSEINALSKYSAGSLDDILYTTRTEKQKGRTVTTKAVNQNIALIIRSMFEIQAIDSVLSESGFSWTQLYQTSHNLFNKNQ